MTETFTHCTAREAIKRITPGSIVAVHLLFQARSMSVSLVQVPKVHVKQMLKKLPADAIVAIVLPTGRGEAYIAGALQPVRTGEISTAAALARGLT